MDPELKEYLDRQFERSGVIAGGYTLMSVGVAIVLAGISFNALESIINGLILLFIGGILTTFPDKFARVIPRLRKIF